MDHLIFIREQYNNRKFQISDSKLPFLKSDAQKVVFKNTENPCFQVIEKDGLKTIETHYYVGVDWIEKNQLAVLVESKLNDVEEVDILQMLFECLTHIENIHHLEGLFHIEYDNQWIEIPEQKDVLSPVLIIQFLSILKTIVRKGLKNDYYRVTSNLKNRVKGKILVGEQIKQNVFKQKINNTVCNYQEYGVDHEENQFLKLVLNHVVQYVESNNNLFLGYKNQLNELITYSQPAFQRVSDKSYAKSPRAIKKNSFYKEYNKAIELGEFILKRLGFNVTKNLDINTVLTPPFWIDMSKLFELYVFGKLKSIFPNPSNLSYHDTFYKKETDILLKENPFKCVIDCKYKSNYSTQTVELADKRQVLGYARLKSIYNLLDIEKTQVIPALIIYPSQESIPFFIKDDLFSKGINEYVAFYKLGIALPIKQSKIKKEEIH